MRHAHSNVARLRGKLAPHRPAIAMASHNPLFAKLAAEAGFDAIWGSGFELSAAYAVPDAGILSADTHLELHSDPGGSIRRPSDPTSTPRFAAGCAVAPRDGPLGANGRSRRIPGVAISRAATARRLDRRQRGTAIRDPARRGAGPHSPRTRSALRKHTASRSISLNGAVSMNRAASSLSSSG